METNLPKIWLEREFVERRKKNASFSLRAFARLIDIPPGRVSQLLSQKRSFTPELGKKIADRLRFNPADTEKFLSAIMGSRKDSRKTKTQAEEKAQNYQLISEDQFQTIAEPLHFEILALIETKNFNHDIRWISKRLAASVVEVRGALDRLERLGLIKIEGEKISLVVSSGLKVDASKTSGAVYRARKQILEHAGKTLDSCDPNLFDISSMTMAIDLKKFPEAKAMIMDFRRKLTKFLEEGEKSQVYRLNVQLVPVSVVEDQVH